MLIPAETLQKLINRAAAQQQQAETVMRYRRAGDEEMARFYDLPTQQRESLLAKQDIAEAVDAANAGDVAGLRQGVTSAVNRVVFAGAQLGKPQRIVPRRKRGR